MIRSRCILLAFSNLYQSKHHNQLRVFIYHLGYSLFFPFVHSFCSFSSSSHFAIHWNLISYHVLCSFSPHPFVSSYGLRFVRKYPFHIQLLPYCSPPKSLSSSFYSHPSAENHFQKPNPEHSMIPTHQSFLIYHLRFPHTFPSVSLFVRVSSFHLISRLTNPNPVFSVVFFVIMIPFFSSRSETVSDRFSFFIN